MIYLKSLVMMVACTAAGLSGCGGGDDRGPPPVYTTQILSDSSFDGDIQQTSPATFTVTQGMSATVQSIFSGIDPATSTGYRAFLDFPLGGAGGLPADAIIESAFLDVYVNSLQPGTASLPIVIELVAFQPPTLIASDYDRTAQPPLATVSASPNFTLMDVGTNASVDVTALMVKAQQLGLVDFQIRILEDPNVNVFGLLEINDSTGTDRAVKAPQLTITYQ